MKKPFFLFVIFIIQFNYSQTKLSTENINKINYKFENLNKKIDSLNIIVKSYQIKNKNSFKIKDSLNKELLFFKVKEDYYAAALGEQSTRFAIIISGILVLFSLISYGTFKYEVVRVKKFTHLKVSKLEDEFKEYKIKLSKTSNDLIGAKGNIYTSIAFYFKKENDFVNAFVYHLLAARNHGEHNENKEDLSESEKKSSAKDKYETTITNLNLSIECLNKITSEKDKINKNIDKINEILDSIGTYKNEKIKLLIAKIRISIYEKTK